MWNNTITVPTVAFETAFTILSAKLNMNSSGDYTSKRDGAAGRCQGGYVTFAGHLQHKNRGATTAISGVAG